MPASWKTSHSTRIDSGDNSDGLCTAELPYARHGAIFQVDSMNGPFHGVIKPNTPTGSRIVYVSRLSSRLNDSLPASSCSSAKKRKFHAERSIIGCGPFIGGPIGPPISSD